MSEESDKHYTSVLRIEEMTHSARVEGLRAVLAKAESQLRHIREELAERTTAAR
jgi:hypothetical protein